MILLLSGKRKSGKDYISEQLCKRLGSERSQIIRISEPIKSAWAKKLNLDLNELLGDGPYKEKYRKAMIEWSDEVRQQDYGFFCREAAKGITKSVVIVSDIRRKNDIKFFHETFGDKVKTIRITASDEVRQERGWKFQSGVDDVQSECDLDDYSPWDFEIQNDSKEHDPVSQIIEAFSLK